MQYRVSKDFKEKKGIISNTHGFLSTYLDGGFKEKWDGYWSPSHKYLDYFAVKINGIWLTENTLKEAKYGKKIIYTHKASNLEINQKITTPGELTGFKVEWEIKNKSGSDTAIQKSIEVGIDIRPKSEDISSQNYAINPTKNHVKIKKDSKWISISGNQFNFEEESYIKEHYPGEKQKCLVPGKISYKTTISPGEVKQAELVFETDGNIEETIESPKGSLKDSELSKTFNNSLESLENLYYGKNNSGVIAGHPWFQNYWARDSFWTALGMIDAGMFEEVEKLLLNYAERDVFPSKIGTDGDVEEEYPRCDSIPLFAIAVDKLSNYYDLNPNLEKRVEEVLTDNRPKGKIVDNHPDGTWMDTLKRRKAVDIQSLWIEALERFDRGTKRLRKGLEEFEEEEYMKDNLEDDFESINPCVPLMFDQVSDERMERYLEKINGEFSSRFGARTRSMSDPGYNSSGYHTGSVWGLTTCWAAAANLEHGQKEHGVNFLKKISQFIDRNQLGALPEVVDAENGENIGCSEQAWSAGLFIHVIDSYLLGIEVEDGKLIVDPLETVSMTRTGKRVGGERVDIKLNNGKVQILNEPNIEIQKGQ